VSGDTINNIHSSAFIGPGVNIGSNNIIGPNVVLFGPLTIGGDNWFGPGVVIGSPPEVRSAPHLADWDEASPTNETRIGNGNIIREGVSIQRSNYRQTVVGDNCFIMSRAYIAHDCVIDNSVTISANVSLAGHCHIQTKSTLGLASTFHQFSVVGSGAMVGMSAAVTRNVPPYAMFYGVPGVIKGANTRGMTAHGFDAESIAEWDYELKNEGYTAQTKNTDLRKLNESWLEAVKNVQLKEHERH
jgi:UDP-N-acetylglucosamine acyltransferase